MASFDKALKKVRIGQGKTGVQASFQRITDHRGSPRRPLRQHRWAGRNSPGRRGHRMDLASHDIARSWSGTPVAKSEMCHASFAFIGYSVCESEGGTCQAQGMLESLHGTP